MEGSIVRLVGLGGGEKADEDAGDGAEVEGVGGSMAVTGAGVRGSAMSAGGGDTT